MNGTRVAPRRGGSPAYPHRKKYFKRQGDVTVSCDSRFFFVVGTSQVLKSTTIMPYGFPVERQLLLNL